MSFESGVDSRAAELKAADAARRAEKKEVFKAELAAEKSSAAQKAAAIKEEQAAKRAALEAAKAKNAEALKASLSDKKAADYKRDLATVDQQKDDFAKRAAERKVRPWWYSRSMYVFFVLFVWANSLKL